MPTFEVEAMVRGYHAYQDSWDALIGEELVCAREPNNLRDPFAVAVVKSDAALGGPLWRALLVDPAACTPQTVHSHALKFTNRAMVVDTRARTCGLRA